MPSYSQPIIQLIQQAKIIPHPFTINQTALKLPFKPIAALLLTLLTATQAQQPPPRTVIFLDPAHGGPDPGAHLPNNLLEKDLTLAFGTRLRAQLSAAGFALLSTRDADPAVPFPTDQRAEIANHAHPAACLILHATSSGSGIHVITSSLAPNTLDDPHANIPWNTAQSTYIPQSLALANEIGLALEHAKLPVILSRAAIRPLDNVICPAVAIEIAPLTRSDAEPTQVTDANYQQTIAKAIAAALSSWRARIAASAGAQR